jgi:hypothetical protein
VTARQLLFAPELAPAAAWRLSLAASNPAAARTPCWDSPDVLAPVRGPASAQALMA